MKLLFSFAGNNLEFRYATGRRHCIQKDSNPAELLSCGRSQLFQGNQSETSISRLGTIKVGYNILIPKRFF